MLYVCEGVPAKIDSLEFHPPRPPRDPNVVAVKAFYGDDLKVNFCGKLASDGNQQVGVNIPQQVWTVGRYPLKSIIPPEAGLQSTQCRSGRFSR